ncbi:DUF2613 domain-containing protein [Corynebacterium uberis]|uniref:DUF2613 domain-containing protein n=1 Tax=Corynebacterium TaxID=1716 RepID=UPI001D0A78AC|nr:MULTISPECIES: DUF2613 domain-containing protein [Corynebacterium]MCZ9309629.1 DUF2613 domain-containing protein [Corynebacterium sp. c6VSa_13]UDL73435.1 DUF2613 domain-containing protein [Corynebacterium uberis]UDL75685.1 DUF2613 domain-containing protein [Corynebacterium uberis]UDL77898.1 DUF2613 domain-containing protein [Corynebacterium uberis]UDL80181.1 DUF2613 domain-containing protein [Corynebacterium uberis]
MAFESDSLTRRTAGPAVASVVVGIALGVVAILGVSAFTGHDSVPQGGATPASSALLGSPEYGSRG